MIYLDVEQGTPEWEKARSGMPTASGFDKIITPKSMKRSESAGKYRNELLAEWYVGYPIDWGGRSGFMDRGKEFEARARAFYEFQTDTELRNGGFCMRDDGKVGCSPDGLVGEEGGVEIKVPALHTHIGYMVDPASFVADYRCQVQGSMYVTSRFWWDMLSFNPELPPVLLRVTRDATFVLALHREVDLFVKDLDDAKRRLELIRNPAVVGGERVAPENPEGERETFAGVGAAGLFG